MFLCLLYFLTWPRQSDALLFARPYSCPKVKNQACLPMDALLHSAW
uniref:Uncharacterized protein n=1 Tax=Anguilla anguilla TaxID=7936 RepID=A0A0E9TXQ5_ANGAN